MKPHMEKIFIGLDDYTKSNWASFEINTDVINGGYRFSVDRSGLPNGEFDDEVNSKCETMDGYDVECYNVLIDFQVAINEYKYHLILEQTDKAIKSLKLYSAEWDEYFTKARSQTPWELALNSLIFHDKITADTFVLPPKYQWILLHPNILLEYVDEAAEGDQFKEALAIELAGINFWNKRIPYGFSAMCTYSDRDGVRDFGYWDTFSY